MSVRGSRIAEQQESKPLGPTWRFWVSDEETYQGASMSLDAVYRNQNTMDDRAIGFSHALMAETARDTYRRQLRAELAVC